MGVPSGTPKPKTPIGEHAKGADEIHPNLDASIYVRSNLSVSIQMSPNLGVSV